MFVSGQGATDPRTGQLAGDDVAAQTGQCLANVGSTLLAAGSSLQCVLRCGVFLLDMAELPRMNAVYARVVGDHRPARASASRSTRSPTCPDRPRRQAASPCRSRA